ncbi:SDR family NAD(P)-dependent oxidoreductase [Pollutimonas bauzanensis]|uniref:NAD(P)-dependent dehydrogenase, short-chain alcohol dehydrogenase family n=1 Tax=Pollutimonas bauzanensis TaxID=658167 RepID=A0A1M5ZYL1_9BURK|nr:SDR family oxidoreductase [Pollutimonas bauzanensis]SHI29312.1 NAD(P)-dependent dehydrogenase, short-chain alcohol dehydrogenase family [Pollutimonas bauzanensis]
MSFRPGLLNNKTAIVTGGTQGIGHAIAEVLAGLGARVHAAGLPSGDGAAYQSERISEVILDVTREDDIRQFVESLPGADILVNCAGIICRGEEFKLSVFERVVNINLTGTMRLCEALRPLLAKSGGCIVNTASMLSFFGGGLVPAYSASKGGIAQLTKSLAIAYAADGIRVNAIAPGWIATPLTEALQNDEARAKPILDRTPLKRWGRPEDVAQAVVFLCCEASAFMTGVVMPVDGGYMVT